MTLDLVSAASNCPAPLGSYGQCKLWLTRNWRMSTTVYMLEVHQTDAFAEWLDGLQDSAGKARIAKRLERLSRGLLGDWKSVGEKVIELRMDFGPGYRVYITRVGETVIFLLGGGDKSTQAQDIERAMALAAEIHP